MSGLPDIEQNNEQILNDIQSLQQMEQELLNNLETNPNLTTQQQGKVVDKMNQISNMRVNLYQTLGDVNNYYQNALTSSTGTLKEQTIAIGIVESELNQSKRRLQMLENEKNNKIRLVEINDYYGDKYAEHAQLMKIIIFILIPIIILAVLKNKEILPNPIYYTLVVIISLIGAYFFWKRMASIVSRDVMNYQEYNWYFDPSTAPTGSTTSTDPWQTYSMPSLSTTCIGQECCSDGQTYDASLNQCIGTSTVTESFVNNVLTKTSGKKRPDYIINSDNNVKPKMSESFINFKL
jgi:hypothetical protein